MSVDLSTLNIIFGIFIFIFGISIGSFINVVAYRVPLKISIITPRSFCPNCKKQISNTALIPILGYFLTKGECNYCKNKISIHYIIVEILCGVLTTLVFFKFLTPEIVLESLPAYLTNQTFQYGKFHFSNYVPFFISLWILYTGIVLSLIDLRYRILPDIITLPGILIGFLISCLNPDLGWLKSLLGILIGSGILFIIAKSYELIRKRSGMGMGDIKYLAFIGAVLGWKGAIFTLFFASLIGSVAGIIWGIYTKKGLSEAIPFGPFLAIAAFMVSTYGNEILQFIF